jgi:long-chain acyl-CoA synthetase
VFPFDDIRNLLEFTAERYKDRVALICVDRHITYGELDALSDQFGNGLRRLGVRPADRVTLWLENGWRWVVAYFGAFKAGAIANPVNSLLTADEVSFISQHCSAKVIISDLEKLQRLPQDTDLIKVSVSGDGGLPARDWLTFASLLEGPVCPPEEPKELLREDRVAAICYTSGTTGRPKGATLTHRNILTNVAMTSLMHGRTREDVVVSALPCTHVYGNVVLNSSIGNASTLILFPKFDAEAVLGAIERYQATLFEGVPTMYYYLLQAPLETRRLSSLRMCTVGGQSIPEASMGEVEQRVGCPLVELWGMTEIGGLGTTHPHTGPYRHGSIGVALPFVETKIVPLQDQPQGDASVGELMVRGPIVMKGYWRDETATAAALTADGWLHTGDIAAKDADGFVRIVDRMSDMILTAGYNIYPAEIERVLATHPGVSMVAVGRLSDALKGEIPKAYVVLKPRVTLSEDELLAYCRQRLAAYKVPRAIQFVADLPKTSTGKIMRRALATLEPAPPQPAG